MIYNLTMSDKPQKTIVITRTAEDCRKLAILLNKNGYKFIAAPTLAIELDMDFGYMPVFDKLLMGEYDWAFLFSKNAVYGLHKILREFERDLPSDLKISVIGENTAEQLKILIGREPDFIPSKSNADSLLKEFNSAHKNKKVLFVLGDKLTKANSALLEENGSTVEQLVVYRNLKRKLSAETYKKLQDVKPDTLAFLFYSPSAVENLHADFSQAANAFSQSTFLAIGETTASAIRERFKIEPLIAESSREESVLRLLGSI